MKRQSLYILIFTISFVSCSTKSNQELGDLRFIILAVVLIVGVIGAVASKK